MTRIAYVDGRYRRLDAPAVAAEDRGYQFGDGVYEMVKVIDGIPRDLDRHLARLARSLRELAIPAPTSPAVLQAIAREVIRRNPLRHATLYIQVTRGVAPRAHPFPANTRPVLTVAVRRVAFPTAEERARGVAVALAPEIRWQRRDIKSINLLPNLLARQQALARGLREALFVEADGTITEATAANVFLVDGQGVLRTHPADRRILGGITRQVVLELAERAGIPVDQRPFTVDELDGARELFLTGTTSLVLPVVRVEGRTIGAGIPGPITRLLGRLYAEHSGLDALAGDYAQVAPEPKS